MAGLALNANEGCLGMCYGRAGRGKSRTSVWYASNNNCLYIRAQKIWDSSILAFLQTLCRELGIIQPPGRKVAAYDRALEVLRAEARPVFIDEVEKLPRNFLEVIRDLSDMSQCVFVLVGEEELQNYLNRDRRVWSRVFQVCEFKPIEKADIMSFAMESGSEHKFTISIDVANYLEHVSEGDFRLVKKYLLMLFQLYQADTKKTLSVDMAKTVVKSSLKGR